MPPHVFETPAALKDREERLAKGRPSHWADDKGTAFINPWDSWRTVKFRETLSLVYKLTVQSPSIPKDVSTHIPIRKPDWGLGDKENDNAEKIKSTWLGHACFLVELPARKPTDGSAMLTRGPRILFDPVFSDRCSPSQMIGPKRFTPPPCKIEDIPEVDVIVISHNHYDHLDTSTLKTLFRRAIIPHIFIPLGNTSYLRSIGVPSTHAHVLDWWESRRIETEITLQTDAFLPETRKVSFDITATPCQHFTGRTLFDNFKSLWASWVVEEVIESKDPVPLHKGVKLFFGGDTGYRAVRDGDDEDEVPTCPVFKDIGARFGGFDFAMIPIGAYMPRSYMSPIHCAPQDSVRLFNDVRAKKALGMHWGAWVLTTEDVVEPPKRLQEECKKIGIEDGAFGVCDVGETTFW